MRQDPLISNYRPICSTCQPSPALHPLHIDFSAYSTIFFGNPFRAFLASRLPARFMLRVPPYSEQQKGGPMTQGED